MFTLTDRTTGQSWDYPTEAKLRTVTRLYAFAHPHAALSVTIGDRSYALRGE